MLLWSFQPLARIAELRRTRELVGSWEHVPASSGEAILGAYRAMVAAMERAGVPTHGRPPVWAWGGARGVTLEDAHSLVGEPLWAGWATVEFTAPAELVLATDYGAWNDDLAARFTGAAPHPPPWDVPTPIGEELVQVCLPVLRAEWVREVRPLPRSAREVSDWSARV
ncbi:hypothetical protein [Pseudonocardia kunmingensis]|uniref:DUF3841 domain-containing protein n=1 Tax=Pseudonocardia kunmingensis TaxID=630975 RepID=A0A543D921_9PSEU|nr:hypothetical protein [Pseudonocardia kunmingensis]TQM05841.1 hypothetical protein FB558_6062 [Pseudonocardia kunmingensis]